MNRERFARLRAILARATELPKDKRAAYLDEACGDDAALRQEAEAILAREGDSPSFLGTDGELSDETVNDPTLPAGPDQRHPESPTRIGPYLLRERIGAGGMGEVWKAEQTEPVRRTVALKLIRAGMDSDQVMARFEAERQALALMDHPYIAKIFDAGVSEQSRPYFVMEHVPGVPITEYCDKRRLDTCERLELFEKVCEGVQHAHQKVVLHRDLKPTNVLVADVDGKPLPKIIDFGVAKATTHKLTEKTMHTAVGQLIGTPEYMSPEQADPTNEDVDTRTDVYSLGVVLYELLVGALPFQSDELRKAGFESFLKILRERDPPRPSTKLSTLGEKTPEIARRRRTEPRRLAGQLKRDLDWIVMRSLEKDRNRRYGSPRELGQDIRRHLADEPVLAGPPNAAYRAGKFVRRHRFGVGIGTVAVLALLGVAVSMGVLRGQAEQARAEAQARAAELEVVTDFQASMLSEIDPEAMGRALREDLRRRVRESLEEEGATDAETASMLGTLDDLLRRANATDVAASLLDDQVLDRAVEAVATEFADQPLVCAALRQTLADTYETIGRHTGALPLQEAALETRRRVLGDEHEDTLYSLTRWGFLQFNTGDLDGAQVSLEEALERSRRVLGDDHPHTLMAIQAMGRYYGRTGDEKRRLLYQQEAMEGSRRAFGDEDPRTLAAIRAVGMSLESGGREDEALPYYREAWKGRRHVLGDDHPSTLESLRDVGHALVGVGRVEEGLPYLREALDGLRRARGDDHPSTMDILSALGFALWSLNRTDEALDCYLQVLEGRKRAYGDNSASTLTAVANVGWVLMDMADFEAARPYVVDGLEGRRETLGDANYKTLLSFAALGWLQMQAGEIEEAVALLESREADMRRGLAANPTYLGMYLTALGRSRVETGRFEAAESVLLEAEATEIRRGNRRRVLKELVRLYETWDVAEQGAGHDRRAAEWREKLAEMPGETAATEADGE